MNETTLFSIFNAIILIILLAMLLYHIRSTRKDHKKTEFIRQDLEEEREKTKKFHVDLATIRRLTKE